MTNYFSGIINSDFKQLFTDALSALFYDDALTLPCTIYYGTTKYEDCSNCVYDPIGQKSSNKFQDGGPVPFPFGNICPVSQSRSLFYSSNIYKLLMVPNNHKFNVLC